MSTGLDFSMDYRTRIIKVGKHQKDMYGTYKLRQMALRTKKRSMPVPLVHN